MGFFCVSRGFLDTNNILEKRNIVVGKRGYSVLSGLRTKEKLHLAKQ